MVGGGQTGRSAASALSRCEGGVWIVWPGRRSLILASLRWLAGVRACARRGVRSRSARVGGRAGARGRTGGAWGVVGGAALRGRRSRPRRLPVEGKRAPRRRNPCVVGDFEGVAGRGNCALAGVEPSDARATR